MENDYFDSDDMLVVNPKVMAYFGKNFELLSHSLNKDSLKKSLVTMLNLRVN